MTAFEPAVLRVARGERTARPPIWLMRQAGRYLPEYRRVREKAKNFLELCYTPELAAEITLQPIRRFDLDAAILFSDILVVPDALGQEVRFSEGIGPELAPLGREEIGELEKGRVLDHLAPVLETVRRVRAELVPDKVLIGFCGAPWTVATYMIGGRGSSDQLATRRFALQEPEAFGRLIDLLVEASAAYLVAQFRAGADLVQLFESWALNLDEVAFAEWVVAPAARIVQAARREIPDAPIIGFPRGAAGMIGRYARETGVDVIGLDYAMPLAFAGEALPERMPVQGNLDPVRLLVGGAQMEERARAIVAAFADRPHIFNLGHGILPETPIENVERLVEIVRKEA